MIEIHATTTVLGAIGHPIEHSFSPQMHNAAIRALGLDWCYVAFHVLPENVGRAMEGMRGLGIRGLNVTVPHKQAGEDVLRRDLGGGAGCGRGEYDLQ